MASYSATDFNSAEKFFQVYSGTGVVGDPFIMTHALSASTAVIGHVILDSGAVTATLAAETTKVIGTVNISAAQTIGVTGTFWQATQPVSGTFWQATQPVSIASMPSTPVTGTFWQATQPVSLTSTTITGTVTITGAATVTNATAANLKCEATIAAAQTLATVTTVGTVTTCSTVTTVSTLTGGGVAHDSADSGNPVKIGARCLASPAVATLVADADRTDLVSDKDGAAIFRNQTTLGDIKSTAQSVTANTSTAATNFGAVASTKNCITHITVWNSSATAGYVALQDGSGGTAFAYVPCPAGGGATLNFDPPLRQPTANTALYFSASPNASTVYVTINGFQSKI